MGFYIRKSISAGPFRFNFSKGGVGCSVGVKGLRIGTGPKGHYIHAGSNGFYYRATLGKSGRRSNTAAQSGPLSRDNLLPQLEFEPSGVDMIEIESGDVSLMRDETSTDLLNDINDVQSRVSYRTGFVLAAIAISLTFLLIAERPAALLFSIITVLAALAIGHWLDAYKRSSVLFYELEGKALENYTRLRDAFEEVANSAGKWHVEAGGAVGDLTTWKRNAGATHIVQKKSTAVTFQDAPRIKSNITPPSISVGKQHLYFFPDALLVFDGSRFGAVSYDSLQTRWQESRFIEDGSVPADALVVGHTWKHPNKSGGPDRRFKSNHQIPICLYEVILFSSSSGLQELIELSKLGVSRPFVASLEKMAAIASTPRDRLKFSR